MCLGNQPLANSAVGGVRARYLLMKLAAKTSRHEFRNLLAKESFYERQIISEFGTEDSLKNWQLVYVHTREQNATTDLPLQQKVESLVKQHNGAAVFLAIRTSANTLMQG